MNPAFRRPPWRAFPRLAGATTLLLCALLGLPAGAAPEAPPPAEAPTRSKRVLVAPLPPRKPSPGEAAEVHFMRRVMTSVNLTLETEDPHCVRQLPLAILREAAAHDLDWRQVFALAWQESAFDCHAKNRRDKGVAYGPFQIRPLWRPVIGDPRPDYFDPGVAVARVVNVLLYFRESERYRELVRRGFRYPLLCLYQSGEQKPVNMAYCRAVGDKVRDVAARWADYQRTRQTRPVP